MQTGYWKRQNSWTFSPLSSSLQAVLYIQGSFGWRMREKTTSIPACTVHTKYGTCTLIRLLSLRWRCRYLGIRMHLYTKMFLLYILSRWPSKEFQVDEKDSPQGPYDLEILDIIISSQFKCLSSLHFSCRGKGSVFGGCSAKGGVFNAKGKIKGKGKASPVKTVLFPGKQFRGVILCRLKWLKQRNETKSCHLKIIHWEVMEGNIETWWTSVNSKTRSISGN